VTSGVMAVRGQLARQFTGSLLVHSILQLAVWTVWVCFVAITKLAAATVACIVSLFVHQKIA
jgi:hypothetical protein